VTRLHHLDQLTEPRLVPVRRAEQADAPLFHLVLEPTEVLSPRDEVVDLLDVDPTCHDRRCPDLGRNRGGGANAGPSQRATEHRFRAAVHRRRVDQPNALTERALDDRPWTGFIGRRDVEHRPRAEPDDRNLEVGATEAPKLHA
jgi:hypothetical protein